MKAFAAYRAIETTPVCLIFSTVPVEEDMQRLNFPAVRAEMQFILMGGSMSTVADRWYTPPPRCRSLKHYPRSRVRSPSVGENPQEALNRATK